MRAICPVCLGDVGPGAAVRHILCRACAREVAIEREREQAALEEGKALADAADAWLRAVTR